MKNIILRFLFDKYRSFFEELMIQELMGKTTNDIEEPAIAFLSNGKQKLEKWVLFQSYYLQRKAVNDIKNAQFYQGAMMYLAIILKVINKEKKVRDEISPIENKEKSKEEKMSEAFSTLKDLSKKKASEEKE